MKLGKITSIILALCMLAALMVMPAAAVAAEAAFGVVDGSFENWGTTGEREPWKKNIPSGSTVTMEPNSTETSNGNYSLQIKGEDTFTSRHAMYQNIGQLPAGETVKVSMKVNIKKLTGTVRLIVRFGGDAGTVCNSLAVQKLENATEGWVELSTQGVIASADSVENTNVVFDVLNASDGCEIYLDDFKVEIIKFSNGDFEKGNDGSWTFTDGATAANNLVTENDNSYAKFTRNGQYVGRTLTGLKSGTTYRISFDICSNEAVGWIGTATGYNFADYNTNGEWQRLYFDFKQAEGVTTRELRFKFSSTTASNAAYVMYDNVVLEEFDGTEPLFNNNNSFEYGDGLLNWTLKWADGLTYEKVTDCVDGTYALQITRNHDSYAQMQQSFSLDGAGYYEFSAYIKNISLADGSFIAFRPSGNDDGSDNDEYQTAAIKTMQVSELPKDKWVRVRYILYRNLSGTETLQVRIGTNGKMLIDNFSCKKIDAPIVNYTKSDGEYCDKLTDGVKTGVLMPATQEHIGDMVVFAIYSRSNNVTSLADVKVQEITEADVTKGYADFTLAADTLDDFDSVDYYAKLLVFQGGTLKPMQKATLLTK